MEEFEFTPKEEPVVQNEAEFSFTPKEEPDFSKLKADEVISTDGTNTNASQKMNAVLNSWIGKGTKIYDAAYAIDQTRKSATRGIFEIEKNLGTLAKVAGDNLGLFERNTEKMINSGGKIGTLLKLMGSNLNAITDKGYTEGEMCRLRTVGDSINEIGDLVQKHADSVLKDKDLQLDEEITKGDFTENPSWTRAFMAMGNAMPSLLGMGVLAKISGPLSAYFVMAGVDSADVYEKAKEKDTSQTEANLRFGSSVVATAAIDKVLGPLEHFMKASPNRLSKKLAKYIFDGALEGTAEGLQTGAQNAFQIYNAEDIQNLGAGVIESMIGGFGSGVVASSLFSEASDNLKKQGATDEEINNLLDMFGMSAQQNADKLSQVAFQEVSKGLKEFDKFIEENMGTPEAQRALKVKAELQDVYDAMYNTMIQAGRPEAEAKSISQIWQGISLFGSQETGMTPMEYLRQNSPKAKAEKYAEFKKKWEEVRNKTDNAPVNPFKLLTDKKVYDEAVKAEKAQKGKSLLAFIKSQGGIIDEGGDLKSRDAIRQYPGLVNNKKGNTLDDMALMAWEKGYLEGEPDYSGNIGRPSINKLLEAIDDELNGVKHYAYDNKEKSIVELVDSTAQALDELGIDYSNMSAKEAEDAYLKAADDYIRKSQNMSEDEEAQAMADYYAGKPAQNNEIDEWADIPFQFAGEKAQDRKQAVNKATNDFIQKAQDAGVGNLDKKDVNHSVNREGGFSNYFYIDGFEIRISDHGKNPIFNTSDFDILADAENPEYTERRINEVINTIKDIKTKDAERVQEIKQAVKDKVNNDFIVDWLKITRKGKNFEKSKKKSNYDVEKKEVLHKYGLPEDYANDAVFNDLVQEKKNARSNEDWYNISQGTFDINEDNIYYQSAFAGSRVDYDTPSLEAIGSGEGAQVHGWGLYYALNKDIAERYRKSFIRQERETVFPDSPEELAIEIYLKNNKNRENTIKELSQIEKNEYKKFGTQDENTLAYINAAQAQDYIRYVEDGRLEKQIKEVEVSGKGQVHEVDLPENPYLLDEDKNYNNQPDYVKEKLKQFFKDKQVLDLIKQANGKYAKSKIKDFFEIESENYSKVRELCELLFGTKTSETTSENLRLLSELLHKHGIKGITYEGRQDGRCFVIFNPKDVKVIQKFYQNAEKGKGAPKGAFTPDNVIHLFEGADASTFMHETAHWFRAELKRFGTARSREMLRKVDAWENAEFDKRYKVELKDGAYVIKDQRGNLVYDRQFNTEEEARNYGRNEIFARGFEQYLRTGKAPNSYLKSAFKSFWNWLRTLYRSARQLNADINQDIEDVYGTILGGEELDFYLNETPERALQQKFADNDERAKLIDENIARAQAMATEPKMFENFVAERTESKKGKAEFLTNLIVPISTRAKRVSQGLKNRLRAYDYALPQKLNEYNSRIKPFMDKWAKFNQDDMVAFDLALKNDYVNKQLAILEKYDAVDDFEAVHDLLNLIYDEAKSVGVDIGYRENYFPREVADVDGLMSYLYGPSAVSELRRAEREAHYEDMLPEEQAEFVNKFLRGYERKDLIKSLPGNVKERRIDVVTSDMNVFYKNSMQALMTYIERMTNSIESRRFWGMDAAHIEESIGAFVDDMIARGEIKPEQDKEVENILRARFKARGVSNKFLLYQKNMAYIYTMGGINSAITQIDDISVALYKAGLWNTVQSIFAPKHKGLSREELGLTRIGEEFMEASTSSKAVSAVFKATGLDKIDAFGKNVLINATFKKFQKMANDNEAKLREYLEPIMEQETDATIEAINNDEITDNVKLLMFNELADMQPISLSEMPEYYLRSGNGRVLYMLKTFALKRIDIFRNEAFDEMRKGNVKGGVQNLFKLSLLMMLCGMGKDALIDLLFGRKIILSDAIVNNLLGLFGFSKYQLYRARSDGFTGLLTSVAVPPILPMWSDLFKDLYKSLFTKNGEDIENWEVWKGIPIIGRFYYWWMGGGYAKEQKKKKKLK